MGGAIRFYLARQATFSPLLDWSVPDSPKPGVSHLGIRESYPVHCEFSPSEQRQEGRPTLWGKTRSGVPTLAKDGPPALTVHSRDSTQNFQVCFIAWPGPPSAPSYDRDVHLHDLTLKPLTDADMVPIRIICPRLVLNCPPFYQVELSPDHGHCNPGEGGEPS